MRTSRITGGFISVLLTGTALSPAALAQAAPPAPAAASTAAPSGDQGDIVVTADKRSENLQSVPISIQAFGQARLEQHQVSGFDDYAKMLPSVSFQSFGPGQSQIYFRGVTSGSDTTGSSHSGSLPTSALYVDEIPLTTIGGAPDMHVYDMQRIEALSGPQGTLFGASSLSGTLRLITNKPSHRFEASMDVSGTSFGKGANSSGGSFDAMVNIPLSNMIALRTSVFYQRDGGYISNISGQRTYDIVTSKINPATGYYTPGTVTVSNAAYAKKNFNDVETFGGRAALGIDLSEDWTATPSIIYQNQVAHGTFLFGPQRGDSIVPAVGDLQVQDFTPDRSTDRWMQAALTIHGKLGTWDVTYAGGYFDRHLDATTDYSDYAVHYQNVETANGYAHYYNSFIGANGTNLDPTQIFHGHDDYTKQSHELRVSSPSSDRFRLTAGMFFQRQTDRIYSDYSVPGLAKAVSPPPPTAATSPANPGFYQSAVPGCGDDVFCTRIWRVDRDYATFADASYDIRPNLTLNAGIRGFIVQNSAEGFSGTASKDQPGECIAAGNNFFPCQLFNKRTNQAGETHRATLTWKVDHDHMIYATYSTGYRPGGVNRLPLVKPYVADTLDNYEIGARTSWFHRRLTLNVTIFQENWRNMQYSLPTPNSNGTLSIYNVGNARIRGVEGDFSAVLGGLTLSGSGAYTAGKLQSNFCNISPITDNPDCSYVAPGATSSVIVPVGTRMPVQPRFKGNITGRYDVALDGANAFVQAVLNHQSGSTAALAVADAAAFGGIKGFETVDVSAGLNKDAWKFEIFMQNVFDTRGILSLNSACIPSACAVYGRAYPVRPQEFGVKLGKKF